MKIKKGIALTIGLLFIVIIFTPSIYADFCKIQPQESTSKQNNCININYPSHPPIYINGNDDFTAENGVTGGNGTEDDPYIIGNWIIVDDGSASSGIFINNTDVYFIIRNCSVSDFSEMYDIGVRFNNVENGGIEDTVVFENDDGINVCESTNIYFNNCTSYENVGVEKSWWSSGINCYNCSNITITSSECFDNQYAGIYFYDVPYATIEDSVFYNHDFYGIKLFGRLSVYNTIKNCKVFNNEHGIFLNAVDYDRHSSYHQILDCEIYDNGLPAPGELSGDPGIRVYYLDDNTIENCTIYHNGRGISIHSSSNNVIRNCKIYNHQFDTPAYDVGVSVAGSFFWKWGAFNNTITECDIYDNQDGILIHRSDHTRIQKNNIFNNSCGGILVTWYDIARINWNNIYGNGFDDELGLGMSIDRSVIDARHNWWGAANGPKTYRYGILSTVLRFWGDGDKIWRLWSILLFRPWEREPVPDAGVK